MKTIRIGIVGAGTVGSSLIDIWKTHSEILLQKSGLSIQLVRICTRSLDKWKDFSACSVSSAFTDVTTDPQVDVVVELVGGTTVAYDVARSAIENKKTVITANKALLSEKGVELFALAKEKGVEIGFEGSVAGAIPIIRTIRTGLVANEFRLVAGILNGTTNFILTKMEKDDLEYSEALSLAQKLGFAEADPSFDVDGIDAAHKVSILAGLAFQMKLDLSQMKIEGIRHITKTDLKIAGDLGYKLKLLAICRSTPNGLEAKVQPTLIPASHPLANVLYEMNAIYYVTSNSGPGMLTGKGAGGHPTASAVFSDILYYGMRRNLSPDELETNLYPPAHVADAGNAKIRCFIRLSTPDRPGILAEIAKILANNQISISYFQQEESNTEPVQLIVLTHDTTEAQIQKSLRELEGLKSVVLEKPVLIRLLDQLDSI